MTTIPIGRPFEMIAMDICSPLPITDHGNRYILVAADYLSKWLECWAIPDQEATTIAHCLEDLISPVSLFSPYPRLHVFYKYLVSILLEEDCIYIYCLLILSLNRVEFELPQPMFIHLQVNCFNYCGFVWCSSTSRLFHALVQIFTVSNTLILSFFWISR